MTAALAAGFTTALADEDVIYRSPEEIQEIGVFYDKNPFGYVDENGDHGKGRKTYAAN
ncbi:MAG: hypothetical protein LUD18_00065 [Lachnospiraceae bacterium]|nr:hypothetical protein [Lachnospiraceae bacterium]